MVTFFGNEKVKAQRSEQNVFTVKNRFIKESGIDLFICLLNCKHRLWV